MVVDNTHTKYLHGKDKKAWKNYREALDAQKKLENWFGGWKTPELRDGEEYDLPVHPNKNGNKMRKGI